MSECRGLPLLRDIDRTRLAVLLTRRRTMQARHGVLVVALMAMALWPAASTADGPVAHAAATCSDYANQKAAQEAADTRDADGDGIYCVISPR
jgi:hypothetical protein